MATPGVSGQMHSNEGSPTKVCHVNLGADLRQAFKKTGSSGYLCPFAKAMQKSASEAFFILSLQLILSNTEMLT